MLKDSPQTNKLLTTQSYSAMIQSMTSNTQSSISNLEEEFTSNNFLSIETDSAYSKEQALQVWDNISKKVEWLPFKCYCAFGVKRGAP